MKSQQSSQKENEGMDGLPTEEDGLPAEEGGLPAEEGAQAASGRRPQDNAERTQWVHSTPFKRPNVKK